MVSFNIVLSQPFVDDGHLRSSLFNIDTRFETTNHVKKTIETLFFGRIYWQRKPDFGLSRVIESRRHNANNRYAEVINLNFRSDHAVASAEASLPERITQYSDIVISFLKLVSLKDRKSTRL